MLFYILVFILKISQKLQENFCDVVFFVKVAGWGSATLSVKRIQHVRFSVNFVKVLRTPIL